MSQTLDAVATASAIGWSGTTTPSREMRQAHVVNGAVRSLTADTLINELDRIAARRGIRESTHSHRSTDV
ncbi:hypothetical protein GCM10023322_33390 [Rugosimonospora acidiphila]|uniref:Uncharacterized protein n=1 Tax=Rugosimonospora acidiphila TaxID=556531 RepID=A0ABP9RUG3_9ACTN